MILVFASSMQDYDPQTDLLRDELVVQKKSFVIINPLNVEDLREFSLVHENGKLRLLRGGSELDISTVYMSRMWRNDCVIDIPQDCLYPTFFRDKIGDFLREISAFLSGVRWFPGGYSDIQNAESKCFLLSLAHKYGLTVPLITINSFDRPKPGSWYRKVLGYPFGITLNVQTREEVVVTLLNSKNPGKSECNEFPWQWQTPIDPNLHIRCVVVGDKIWSSQTEETTLGGKSLREAQIDTEIIWRKHRLPTRVCSCLKDLIYALHLDMACPEFIVDTNGNYIFIDLNPCGDWFGFFEPDSTAEIIEMIASNL